MDLQLAFELRSPAGTTPHAELYPAMLDMAEWADRNGFTYVNFGEHHVSDSGYCPSPLIACAAVAGRTRRIRMRPNILIAPLYDPIKLAEDTAVLSLASGGRFDLAMGGGYRDVESHMFGKDPKARWKDWGETATLLLTAWTGEPFEYQGRTVRVLPKPDPRPTLTMGGSTPAAAKRAARLCDGFALPFDPELWEPYREACRELGKPDPGPAEPRGPVFLWVAEDVEAAWRMLMPHIMSQIEEYGRFTTEAYGEAAGPYAGTLNEAAVRNNKAYRVMTPDEAVALGRGLGPDGLMLFNPLMGGIPVQEAWRMLKLLETKVLPAVS
jgi:alkanesulfonate monooxygenase SsuD/methylene tetrahydromethanopterin reductase-like flavin-dependent oxidoreductase (luciferase family)